MIRKILIPLELDAENDSQVTQYAVELSKVFGAKLILFHANELPATYPTGTGVTYTVPMEPTFYEDEEDLREMQLNALLEQVPDLRQAYYEYIILPGMATDLIPHQAEENGADLIVMGTEGAWGIDEYIGTVAEIVSRHASCPVLILPRDYTYRPLKQICLAVDRDHRLNDLDLNVLMLLAKGYDANLHVIHIHGNGTKEDTQSTFINQLKSQAEEYKVRYNFQTILSDDTEESVTEFAEKKGINVLAVIYREHGFFKRIFNPGLRRKLVFHSDIPILILK